MKHVFSVLSIASVAFFTLFLSTTNVSCKKGDDGAKGDTGTANVRFSAWTDVTFTPAKNNAGDTVAWVSEWDVNEITKGILDSGTIKVYVNVNTPADPFIVPLPVADLYYALLGIESLNVYFNVGKINMYATSDVSTGLTSSNEKAFQYRYVIIPGGVRSNGRQATVDFNDYQAVKKFYNLKD